ncbi:MAG: glycosyltransferase family 4 protein [Candidatus Omnitrophota bacterium]
MKVLLLANHVNFGGITAYMLNLCQALAGKDGFEYVVASRGGDLEKELIASGVRHIRVPLSTKCEVSPKMFISFLRLLPIVRADGIDVFHANTRVTQVLASLLSLATKKPYISTCHGYFRPRIARRLFPCWGKKVIAISDQVRQHLIDDFRLDPSRVELIYNGIDLKKFRDHSKDDVREQKIKLGLDPDKKVIGHIGRLSSVKGQNVLVLAAERMMRARKDIQFLIIGDGDEAAELARLIREKNLQHNVFIRPSMPDTSLALSLMDVFCMPSLQEGLGISILEAMASGVPVVASRVGGIPSIIKDGETGLLCAAGDVGSFSASLSKILNDKALAESLIEKAKQNIREKFSLDTMAQKTRRLYLSTSGHLEIK